MVVIVFWLISIFFVFWLISSQSQRLSTRARGTHQSNDNQLRSKENQSKTNGINQNTQINNKQSKAQSKASQIKQNLKTIIPKECSVDFLLAPAIRDVDFDLFRLISIDFDYLWFWLMSTAFVCFWLIVIDCLLINFLRILIDFLSKSTTVYARAWSIKSKTINQNQRKSIKGQGKSIEIHKSPKAHQKHRKLH